MNTTGKTTFKMVGKIKEAHGLRGEFYVLVFSGDTSWLSEIKELQFRNPLTEEAHTFKISKARVFKKGLIVSVDGVSDRTQAEKYHGFSFWIPEELFVSKPGETIFLSEIADFMIRDLEGKNLGQIIGFSNNGAQDILIVQTEKNKSDIPFVAPFIKEINFEGKFIVMDLPEGLLNIEDL